MNSYMNPYHYDSTSKIELNYLMNTLYKITDEELLATSLSLNKSKETCLVLAKINSKIQFFLLQFPIHTLNDTCANHAFLPIVHFEYPICKNYGHYKNMLTTNKQNKPIFIRSVMQTNHWFIFIQTNSNRVRKGRVLLLLWIGYLTGKIKSKNYVHTYKQMYGTYSTDVIKAMSTPK